MPIYELQGPDGTIYEVEGPEDASNESLIAGLKSHLETSVEEKEDLDHNLEPISLTTHQHNKN